MARARKSALKRNQATGIFEPPWSGWRRQQELLASAMSEEERREAERLARLLVTTGLPPGWLEGEVVEVEGQGELFDF